MKLSSAFLDKKLKSQKSKFGFMKVAIHKHHISLFTSKEYKKKIILKNAYADGQNPTAHPL